MAYAPSWRVVMNEDVMAKLDVLIGMVGELQAGQRSLKESVSALKESMNTPKESVNTQRERIARMEGRLDEQSRILVALIPTQLAAVPRPAA
jgi:peptidoglycan hydrolase CwlO-like protein